MRLLTDRQQEALDHLRDQIADHGRPPTLEEIRSELGYRNRSAVQKVLGALEKKRRIARDKGRHRNIRVIC